MVNEPDNPVYDAVHVAETDDNDNKSRHPWWEEHRHWLITILVATVVGLAVATGLGVKSGSNGDSSASVPAKSDTPANTGSDQSLPPVEPQSLPDTKLPTETLSVVSLNCVNRNGKLWLLCPGMDDADYCDGNIHCSISNCDCDAGQRFCTTAYNPCYSNENPGSISDNYDPGSDEPPVPVTSDNSDAGSDEPHVPVTPNTVSTSPNLNLELVDTISSEPTDDYKATVIPNGMTTSLSATKSPTESQSEVPSVQPTESNLSSDSPSGKPTSVVQSVAPSVPPTDLPTVRPTVRPTDFPTERPMVRPTHLPTALPTVRPTDLLTARPTVRPTDMPTVRSMEFPTWSFLLTCIYNNGKVWPLCPSMGAEEYCDSTIDCFNSFCDCEAGYQLCETGSNPCHNSVSDKTIYCAYDDYLWPVCPGMDEDGYCDRRSDCFTPFCDCEVGQHFCQTGTNYCYEDI